MAAAVIRPRCALDQALALELVDHRDQGRAIDAEYFGKPRLAQSCIRFDQCQHAELSPCHIRAVHAGGEILKHRRLGAPQMIAE